MGVGGLPMTQSITQIFSNKGSSGGGLRSSDDGGYAKPDYGADCGGDFSKLDFDKPLFDYRSSKDSPGSGDHHDGQPGGSYA